MNNEKKRILSYDIIRILAMGAVVMVHCAATYMEFYPGYATSYRLAAIIDSLARLGVQMFIMLSGALMLDENREMNVRKALRYAGRIALLLICWSLLYAIKTQIIEPYQAGEVFSLRLFLWRLLTGNFHMWFLYMLIGLYLITPILRLFVKKENRTAIRYFLVLSLIFHFLCPVINFFFNQVTSTYDYTKEFLNQFQMGFVNAYVAYYILGWYLTNFELNARQRKGLYLLGTVGLLSMILGTILFSTESYKSYSVFINDMGIFTMLYSVGAFVFLLYFMKAHPVHSEKAKKLTVKLSNLSFGVYMIHIMVLDVLEAHVFAGKNAACIPLIWAAAVTVSLALTFVLSKIPGVRKLVRG